MGATASQMPFSREPQAPASRLQLLSQSSLAPSAPLMKSAHAYESLHRCVLAVM